MKRFSRTEMLIGTEGLNKLKKSRVAIFGIGGVGSFAAEGLARSGVGSLVLIDSDYVDITNINRQIHSATSTIGRPKVEVMKERILDINPEAEVLTYQKFIDVGNISQMISDDYDYIVDAIDTVPSKIELITEAKKRGVPIISSMGAGNKLDPTRFRVDDIYRTSVCPLAKVIRKELRNRGIQSLKVVYSTEQPIKAIGRIESTAGLEQGPEGAQYRKKTFPGSISFVPSVAGLIIAGEVIKDLLGIKTE